MQKKRSEMQEKKTCNAGKKTCNAGKKPPAHAGEIACTRAGNSLKF